MVIYIDPADTPPNEHAALHDVLISMMQPIIVRHGLLSADARDGYKREQCMARGDRNSRNIASIFSFSTPRRIRFVPKDKRLLDDLDVNDNVVGGISIVVLVYLWME